MSTVLVSKKPCEKEIAKVYWILAEIAGDAALTQTLCSEALQSDSKEEMILAIEVIVKKMGWSADHGTGIIKGDGKPTHNGGAEEWFMFPSYETVEGLEIFPRLKEKNRLLRNRIMKRPSVCLMCTISCLKTFSRRLEELFEN